jgi:hypothetical protein
MVPPRIIAICGRRRAGKDTIADFFVKQGYTHVKIAGKMKDVMETMFGFTRDQLESDEKELVDPRWGITPRQAMQFFGTEVMQYKIQELLPDVGRTFWVNSIIADISRHPSQKFVISDMRFVHEYQRLREHEHGVYVIKVVKPDQEECGNADQHVSEKEYCNIPESLKVYNDGTINDLYEKLRTHFN